MNRILKYRQNVYSISDVYGNIISVNNELFNYEFKNKDMAFKGICTFSYENFKKRIFYYNNEIYYIYKIENLKNNFMLCIQINTKFIEIYRVIDIKKFER